METHLNSRSLLYAVALQSMYHLCLESISSILLFYRLDSKIQELEKKYHVPHRWVPTDVEYLEVQRSFSMEKKNQISEALWATCTRRLFLLKLKLRYAGKYFAQACI